MRFSHAVKFIIVFGAGLALGLAASFFVFQKESVFPVKDIEIFSQGQQVKTSASLMIDFQDGRIIICNNQRLVREKRTVLNLLENCSKDTENPFELDYDTHPEFGAFIKKIGNRESGKDNKYWLFWVNNEYSQVGASQFQLKNKDVVEWKFIASEFE